MKQSLFVVTALAALSVAGAASALDSTVTRQIRASGLPVSSDLGSLQITALGAQGKSCVYLAAWESPYNPNDVALCVLRERRTPVNPSCIDNAFEDITTFVSAGPGAEGGDTVCDGFDTLGILHEDVTLLTGEYSVAPILQGVAIFPTAVPLVHAIEVA